MRTMEIKVGLEIEQLAFKISGCPEQHAIQTLAADGADQPLDKWMGQRNVRHGLDLSYIQDSQICLPLVKAIQRVVVGAEIFRN